MHNVDLSDIILNKRSQIQKNIYSIIQLFWAEKKKNEIFNLWCKKKTASGVWNRKGTWEESLKWTKCLCPNLGGISSNCILKNCVLFWICATIQQKINNNNKWKASPFSAKVQSEHPYKPHPFLPSSVHKPANPSFTLVIMRLFVVYAISRHK